MIYAAEYEIIRRGYIFTTILKSIFLSYVFYAFLQISRDLARILLQTSKINTKAKPVLIYGAGSAGNDLYQAIKHDTDINIIGFFDNSKALSGAEINRINKR